MPALRRAQDCKSNGTEQHAFSVGTAPRYADSKPTQLVLLGEYNQVHGRNYTSKERHCNKPSTLPDRTLSILRAMDVSTTSLQILAQTVTELLTTALREATPHSGTKYYDGLWSGRAVL